VLQNERSQSRRARDVVGEGNGAGAIAIGLQLSAGFGGTWYFRVRKLVAAVPQHGRRARRRIIVEQMQVGVVWLALAAHVRWRLLQRTGVMLDNEISDGSLELILEPHQLPASLQLDDDGGFVVAGGWR
jgi:hypothetical protein